MERPLLLETRGRVESGLTKMLRMAAGAICVLYGVVCILGPNRGELLRHAGLIFLFALYAIRGNR